MSVISTTQLMMISVAVLASCVFRMPVFLFYYSRRSSAFIDSLLTVSRWTLGCMNYAVATQKRTLLFHLPFPYLVFLQKLYLSSLKANLYTLLIRHKSGFLTCDGSFFRELFNFDRFILQLYRS